MQPVGDYLEFCGNLRNAGGQNNINEIKSLITEQSTFRKLQLETCVANLIEAGA